MIICFFRKISSDWLVPYASYCTASVQTFIKLSRFFNNDILFYVK